MNKHNIIIAFGIALCFFSCQSNSSTERESTDSLTKKSNSDPQIPQKYNGYFKVMDQSKFSFEFDDIEQLELIAIDSIQMIDLLKNDELLKYNNSVYSHYFYSYQSPRPKHQAITLVINTDYYHAIWYLIYSLDGSLISKFKVAGQGGDGPFSDTEYGYFENDTTYVKINISKEYPEGSETAKVDSVSERIVFNSNGELVYH